MSCQIEVVGNRAVELVVGIDLGKIIITNVIHLIFSFSYKEIMKNYANSNVVKDLFEPPAYL
jgi:hypothetical protein